uniref:Uncharacterized protein n=1 Tax=Ornithorhynchus anatinus TaxID=9258 RepID=A0A6I8PBU3_ORNAN
PSPGWSGGSRRVILISALDRSQSKRDGGFKNNWSFDNAEESEGDTEKETSGWCHCEFPSKKILKKILLLIISPAPRPPKGLPE